MGTIELNNVCGVSGKRVPVEDLGRCNNAEGCDDCEHFQEEEPVKMVVEGFAEPLMDFMHNEDGGIIFTARVWGRKALKQEKKFRITIEEITATAGN